MKLSFWSVCLFQYYMNSYCLFHDVIMVTWTMLTVRYAVVLYTPDSSASEDHQFFWRCTVHINTQNMWFWRTRSISMQLSGVVNYKRMWAISYTAGIHIEHTLCIACGRYYPSYIDIDWINLMCSIQLFLSLGTVPGIITILDLSQEITVLRDGTVLTKLASSS